MNPTIIPPIFPLKFLYCLPVYYRLVFYQIISPYKPHLLHWNLHIHLHRQTLLDCRLVYRWKSRDFTQQNDDKNPVNLPSKIPQINFNNRNKTQFILPCRLPIILLVKVLSNYRWKSQENHQKYAKNSHW